MSQANNNPDPEEIIPDSPDPENIIWDHEERLDPEKYLDGIGRGNEKDREKINSDEARTRLEHPKIQTLDNIVAKWKSEGITEGYPLIPDVQFDTMKNTISPRAYDEKVRNGDSYFSACKALVIKSYHRVSVNEINSGDASIWGC